MLKNKIKQKTTAIRMVRLLFMHWLLLVRPMLGMWTLEHLHTCYTAKIGSKLMRSSCR
jgi:hypothetical protein